MVSSLNLAVIVGFSAILSQFQMANAQSAPAAPSSSVSSSSNALSEGLVGSIMSSVPRIGFSGPVDEEAGRDQFFAKALRGNLDFGSCLAGSSDAECGYIQAYIVTLAVTVVTMFILYIATCLFCCGRGCKKCKCCCRNCGGRGKQKEYTLTAQKVWLALFSVVLCLLGLFFCFWICFSISSQIGYCECFRCSLNILRCPQELSHCYFSAKNCRHR